MTEQIAPPRAIGAMDTTLPAAPRMPTVDLARARVNLTYRWRHGCWPDLAAPTRFNELVQVRKLQDRDARMPVLADKVRAKVFVADRLGRDWVIPTLWHGTTLPDMPPTSSAFVVKSRHGCNQRAFVRFSTENWPAIRRRAAGWMRRGYGGWLDEWAYSQIPRGLLIEPFIGENGTLPVDWKVFVFGGRACFVQVHLERETQHRWIVMDLDWRRVSAPTADADPAPPTNLRRMLCAAEALATGFDFVRVDFYEVAGRPLFGEMTFYPGSGLDPFDPVALDGVMGRAWLDSITTS